MADKISATKRINEPKNLLAGYAADALNAFSDWGRKRWALGPESWDQKLNLLGVNGLARTLDRISYGEPLTTGKGMTTALRPDTVDALGFVPLSPKTAAAVLSGGMHAAPGVEHAATVWHGTPHKFDKFDSSKIGTGEGAQAYGHGLYLAESPEVAGSYSGKLSSELTYNGKPMQRESSSKSKDAAAWALYLANGDKEVAKASGLVKSDWLDKLDPSKLKPGGQLYKVDLPDEAIARMLDWDKPLSQQAPEVQAAAQRIAGNLDPAARKLLGNSLPTLKGSKLYELLASDDSVAGAGKFGAAASSVMRQHGIPGIRYLDGGSRGTGQGTSNFVVFPGEENMLTILERNGRPIR